MTDKEKEYRRDHSIVEAISKAYAAGQEDEALEPIVLVDEKKKPVGRIKNKNFVIFYDIRGEREVELTRSLTDPNFSNFKTKEDMEIRFVTMIQYEAGLNVRVAFPPDGKVEKTLAEVVTGAGLKIVKIAESEKAVHVGYFMNGKNEDPFFGEERVFIPSPEVDNYAEVPEMSAKKIVEQIEHFVKQEDIRLIVANLANVDVVGHIEDKNAVLKAVENVDCSLGEIERICRENNVTLLVTSDHGTVEEWLYKDGTVNTGHTSNPVPFILADFSTERPFSSLVEQGELSDVAPTVLDLLELEYPEVMTGRSLIRSLKSKGKQKRIVLLILDGWGIRESTYGNMIREARTGHFDKLWEKYPHTTLAASGEAVGMPSGTVGNSESGHLHIGAGRRILLDRIKIDKAIEDGNFFKNKILVDTFEEARLSGADLHMLGIVSFYSSHGTIDHLFALLELAKNCGIKRVYIHSLIGRRGEKPESGAAYIGKVIEKCRELSLGEIVTVMGRFWALDREENWDRVEKAYRALVFGEGIPACHGFEED
ncbi:MAG: alkaline phosphatase family protein [Candidatus Aminicenantes bacterium]|nr:alkaline phosphatase family protein [Candidatus Aminicenantes bacterium]